MSIRERVNKGVKVRYLTEKDIDELDWLHMGIKQSVLDWLDIEEAVWGVLYKEQIIGVCTVGYADDISESITNYEGWTIDSLVISNVLVRVEYRGYGVGSRLIREVIQSHSGLEGNLIFLTIMDNRLKKFYGKLGFNIMGDGYSMVYVGNKMG